MNRIDAVWAAGRITIGSLTRAFVPLRVYGAERIPLEGGVVLGFNHFHWIDPPCFGSACPRTMRFLAKIEAHRAPGLGQLIRSFGALSVRRGESDRDAVRLMRQVVREGEALGLFAEGTRQRSGVPGPVQPGAAMVAIQEDVPIVVGAIHGSQHWHPGNWHPVSIAWSEPFRLEGLPRGGKGYKEGSAILQERIRRQWDWLVELHERGRRPRHATPPA